MIERGGREDDGGRREGGCPTSKDVCEETGSGSGGLSISRHSFSFTETIIMK